jgi:hypothetical protein
MLTNVKKKEMRSAVMGALFGNEASRLPPLKQTVYD